MAVYRQIQITFWQDKFVLKLTPEEKFFYLYLLSNSKTKQCGIYELPFSIVQFETGYNLETVKKLISKFEASDRVVYDYETDEIAILNWRKYNDSSSHKTQVCVMGELANIKSRRLLELMGYEESDIVFAKKSYRVSDKLRSKVLLRDENKCLKCGSIHDLTIDHVFPRALGGKSDEFNLRTLCRSCNSKRILIGEGLEREIRESGYDFDFLKNTYQSPIGGEPQKEKEEEKEKTEEKEEARLLWISIFLHNAGAVEIDFVLDLFAKFDKKRAKRILREFKEQGFHKIRTMRDSLDDNGNIRPKIPMNQGRVIEHNPA